MTILQAVPKEIEASGNYGWIMSAGLVLVWIIREGVKIYQTNNNNSTKVKLSDREKDIASREDLEARNLQLIKKLDEVETSLEETNHKLDKVLSHFKIIKPLFMKLAEDPAYKDLIENVLEELIPKPFAP